MDPIPDAIEHPPTAGTVDPTDLAAQLPSLLPPGWHVVDVPGVERPVVVGPGGVLVLVARHHTSLPIGLDDPSPWPDRRHRMSTPQVTAELTSQLLAARSGLRLRVRPLVVVDSIDALVLDRPDRVHVVHRDQLAWWLDHQPLELGASEVARVARSAHPAFDPSAV